MLGFRNEVLCPINIELEDLEDLILCVECPKRSDPGRTPADVRDHIKQMAAEVSTGVVFPCFHRMCPDCFAKLHPATGGGCPQRSRISGCMRCISGQASSEESEFTSRAETVQADEQEFQCKLTHSFEGKNVLRLNENDLICRETSFARQYLQTTRDVYLALYEEQESKATQAGTCYGMDCHALLA